VGKREGEGNDLNGLVEAYEWLMRSLELRLLAFGRGDVWKAILRNVVRQRRRYSATE
jgi:hypothetical protein